ncbi:MAG: pyridoxamine 5'-phosphate oxidase family protein [Chloroflexi bacterium]|nr:pyridoxamine 5'-phosphate oxidase family protein [Chloroflexota bacterium]
MSKELGNELPDDLYRALSAGAAGAAAGTAIVVSTIDAEGWAHPALLSAGEVSARDRHTLRTVTYADSRTTANMRANGKVTLIFVDERMTYYVKGTAAEAPSPAGTPEGFATMDVTVHQVLADAAGPSEGSATITSGITFARAQPLTHNKGTALDP